MVPTADLSTVPVDELGEHARKAFDCWRRTNLRERTARLARLRNLIIDEMDAIAGRLTALTGKTPVEAVMRPVAAPTSGPPHASCRRAIATRTAAIPVSA